MKYIIHLKEIRNYLQDIDIINYNKKNFFTL